MDSTLARGLRDEQTRSILELTPAERLALALELGERDVQIYMSAHGVSREKALETLRSNKHKGRRPSCASINPG